MLDSVERRLPDYKVPSGMKDDFQNIATFAQNVTLKDMRKIDACESDISRWWGDTLLKYVDDGLSIDDLADVMSFIVAYDKNYAPSMSDNDKAELDELAESYRKDDKNAAKSKAAELLRHKDWIFYNIERYDDSDGSFISNKLKADQNEIKSIMNWEDPIIMSFIIRCASNGESSAPIPSDLHAIIGPEKEFARITILYKELNPEYRRILSCEMREIGFMENSGIDDFSNIAPTSIELLPESKSQYSLAGDIRKLQDSMLLQDITDDNGETTSTTKRFMYLYGNPYIARKAKESDIIAYYSGDPYACNSYGRYIYERQQIRRFLCNFSETRDYYYKVLMNAAFINDDHYHEFEKMFILYWAIERTLAEKAKTITDIDSYNRDDIINFMESFGLSELTPMMKDDDFTSAEILAKRIIKSYVSLMQNKGSQNVIDILQRVFSVSNMTLTVYRYIMVKNAPAIKNDAPEYTMVRVSFDDDNTFGTIKRSAKSGVRLNSFINGDPYWKSDNAGEDVIQEYDVDVANTKYLSAEMEAELSESYYRTRITISILRYIESKNPERKPVNASKVFKDADMRIGDYLDHMMQLIDGYMNSLKDSTSFDADYGNCSYDFRFSESALIDSIGNKSISDSLRKRLNALKKSLVDDEQYSSNMPSLTNAVNDVIDYMLNGVYSDDDIDGETRFNDINALCWIFLADTEDDKRSIIYRKDDGVMSSVDSGYATNSADASERAPAYINALTAACDELNAALGKEMLLFNIHISDQAITSFLEDVLDYFISYTTRLKDVEYIKRMSGRTERVLLGDHVDMTIRSHEADFLYYDDSMRITMKEDADGK